MFKCIYIGGTFDCLHRGHIELLRNARDMAYRTVVGLNTDEFATRYKRKPLLSMVDRWAVLSQCRLVDRVIANIGGEDSKPAIFASGADVIGHGSDWMGESLMVQMGLTHEWLAQWGISMVYMPYTAGVSTTAILAVHQPPVVHSRSIPQWLDK